MKTRAIVVAILIVAFLPYPSLAATQEGSDPKQQSAEPPPASDEGGYNLRNAQFYPARFADPEYRAIFSETDPYAKQGRLGEVEEKIQKIIDEHPDDVDVLFRAYMMMGHAKFARKEYDEAIGFYQKAYDVCPDEDVYLTLKGLMLQRIAICYGKINKNDDAARIYMKIVNEYPPEKVDTTTLNVPRMPLVIARHYVREGRTKEAISFLESVLSDERFKEHRPEMVLSVASCYAQEGKNEQAIEYLSDILLSGKYREAHPFVLRWLAEMYGASGDFEKSKECLTRINLEYPEALNMVKYANMALEYIEKNGEERWQADCRKMMRMAVDEKGEKAEVPKHRKGGLK